MRCVVNKLCTQWGARWSKAVCDEVCDDKNLCAMRCAVIQICARWCACHNRLKNNEFSLSVCPGAQIFKIINVSVSEESMKVMCWNCAECTNKFASINQCNQTSWNLQNLFSPKHRRSLTLSVAKHWMAGIRLESWISKQLMARISWSGSHSDKPLLEQRWAFVKWSFPLIMHHHRTT